MLVSKLKTRFGVDAELDTRACPTVKRSARPCGSRAVIKQTGGSGQFGGMSGSASEPNEESEVRRSSPVFGGSVPKNFFPAVERGLREAVLHGPPAGYPVVNLACVLCSGSYHPVDSSGNRVFTDRREPCLQGRNARRTRSARARLRAEGHRARSVHGRYPSATPASAAAASWA